VDRGWRVARARDGHGRIHRQSYLPRRWVVERTFGWINKHRRCVRDYETLPEHHEAMVHIAMIMTMSRRLAHTGDQ
jgi:transposase